VRNASRYRQLLQGHLADIFASFADTLDAIDDVISREAFKRCTLRVLRVWKDWYLFSEEVIAGLQATLVMRRTPEWRNLCHEQVKVRDAHLGGPHFIRVHHLFAAPKL
jgi:hypothetical protein